MLLPGDRTLQLDSFAEREIKSMLVCKEMSRKLEHNCYFWITGVMIVLESVEQCTAHRRLIELCVHTRWFRLTQTDQRAHDAAINLEDCADRRIRHSDTSGNLEV